jgi:zinc transporter ZupT
MTWEFLQRWYMPFVWITLSSLVAVPMAAYFEHGMPLRPGGELGLAHGSACGATTSCSIVPYLFGLGSDRLFNADGSTRWAAFWALLIAVVRIAAPITLVSMSDVSLVNGQHYIDWNTMRILIWFQDFQLFAAGVMLWYVFGHFVGQSGGAPAPAHAEATSGAKTRSASSAAVSGPGDGGIRVRRGSWHSHARSVHSAPTPASRSRYGFHVRRFGIQAAIGGASCWHDRRDADVRHGRDVRRRQRGHATSSSSPEAPAGR